MPLMPPSRHSDTIFTVPAHGQGPSPITLAEWSVDIRDKDGEGVEKRRTGPGVGSQSMPENRTLSLTGFGCVMQTNPSITGTQ